MTLRNYKRIRTKYSTQIEEGMFDPNGFMEDMKPFFADRERKYLAYTSEKNEIDDRQPPKTKIIKVNNKIHAGMFNVVVDQAVNHFVGKPVKLDYDVTTKQRNLLQKMKDRLVGNLIDSPTTPKEFDEFNSKVESMRFNMLNPDTATFQGACGVAFRLIEPKKWANLGNCGHPILNLGELRNTKTVLFTSRKSMIHTSRNTMMK